MSHKQSPINKVVSCKILISVYLLYTLFYLNNIFYIFFYYITPTLFYLNNIFYIFFYYITPTHTAPPTLNTSQRERVRQMEREKK